MSHCREQLIAAVHRQQSWRIYRTKDPPVQSVKYRKQTKKMHQRVQVEKVWAATARLYLAERMSVTTNKQSHFIQEGDLWAVINSCKCTFFCLSLSPAQLIHDILHSGHLQQCCCCPFSPDNLLHLHNDERPQSPEVTPLQWSGWGCEK